MHIRKIEKLNVPNKTRDKEPSNSKKLLFYLLVCEIEIGQK
jgi:hypothetical protein